MRPAPLPRHVTRERAQEHAKELVSEAVAAETRRCAAIALRAYEANKDARPKAAEIARRIQQEIEDGDPGF